MKKKIIKNKRDQLWIAISLTLAIIISYLVSYLSQKSNFEIHYKAPADTSIYQRGSAIRKETHNRQNYERDYRQKSKEWQDRYSKILENKENETNLKPLQSQDTNKNEN
ncbi:MAG: hypothetical protein ACLFQM_01000 [Fidelibacterota bacterium]